MTIRTFNYLVVAPPPRLTVSEWADEYRFLSAEASAESGKWKTSRAEYQRGIMDAFSDPLVHTVVWMSSAQVGKTECLNNIVGYFVDQDPAPILLLQPTLEMAQAWSKDRLAPMIRDCATLTSKISDSKSRDSGNTILHKVFQGGHITMAGANSPASLASRPIRVVLMDEIDRYGESAGVEGDAVNLATKRTTTFWNRKRMLTSTPTIKGVSRIERAYEESDKRRYHVPCPQCETYQPLLWRNVFWEKDKPETAKYHCEHCGAPWTDAKRWAAVKKGEWIAELPFNGTAGFHLSELYSPWVALSDMARNFIEAKKSPATLKTFINTSLGETWEEEGVQLSDDDLVNRREEYREVPENALVLVAGVDTQPDRLEIEVKGFGVGDESWGVQFHIIHGDTNRPKVWQDLDTFLTSTFQNELGYQMRIACTCIDSGGHNTDAVYRYCKGKEERRIFAVKGASTPAAPLVGRMSKSNKAKVALFMIGTDTAKELIFSRLKIEEFGAGYMHFPTSYDGEYFAQLTAEKLTTKFTNGFPKKVWVKTRPRNEALDITVYCLAALAILNPNYKAIKASIEAKKEKKDPIKPKPKPTRKSNFVNGWRQ